MEGSRLRGLPAVSETQLLCVCDSQSFSLDTSPEPHSYELAEAFCPSGTHGEIRQLTSVTTKLHWAHADGGGDLPSSVSIGTDLPTASPPAW